MKDMLTVSHLYLFTGLYGAQTYHAFKFPAFFVLFDHFFLLFAGWRLGKNHGPGERWEVKFDVCGSEFGGVVWVEHSEPDHHLRVDCCVGLPYLFDDYYDCDNYAYQ